MDDGSADGSARHLESGPTRSRSALVEENRGKGAAIACWCRVECISGRLHRIIDADGDIDPVFIRDYYHRITLWAAISSFASKDADGSPNSSSPIRKVMPYAFKSTVRLALRLPVDDAMWSQGCPWVVFKQVLPRMREDRLHLMLSSSLRRRRLGTDFHAAPVEINGEGFGKHRYCSKDGGYGREHCADLRQEGTKALSGETRVEGSWS